MSSPDLPPYAAQRDPAEQEVWDLAYKVLEDVSAVMDRHEIDERLRTPVLEKVAYISTYSAET